MSQRHIKLLCSAEGSEGRWQAICLDLDLAVQGKSFEEVYEALNEMIVSYFETVSKYPAEEQARFLRRKAPFWLRVKVAASYLFSSLFGRDSDTDRHSFTATRACPV